VELAIHGTTLITSAGPLVIPTRISYFALLANDHVKDGKLGYFPHHLRSFLLDGSRRL
jgi:hypothetical protein